VEDLFGWSAPVTIIAAVLNWCLPHSDRWHAAVVYVLGDVAFFYPLYGALILVAARGMHGGLQSGTAGMGKVAQTALMPLSWLLVVALWIVDGVENLAGSQRIGVTVWAHLACTSIQAWRRCAFRRSMQLDPFVDYFPIESQVESRRSKLRDRSRPPLSCHAFVAECCNSI